MVAAAFAGGAGEHHESDWETGNTVHCSIFGHATAGNGAYALVQIVPDGDMLFNSIAGPARVPLATAEPTR